MSEGSRRVTLTKVQRSSPEGSDLIGLLLELSDDGVVTREEMNRLREWLEVDHGVDFAACAFLHETIENIGADGEITEEELDILALGIERVLPSDVRVAAREKRKQKRDARRAQQKEARAEARAVAVAQRAARAEARPLHRGDFIIAGARRSAERRDGCASLDIGEGVSLEREPDNAHDGNAILIYTTSGEELGYVPREDAREMAVHLDAGAACEAHVKKLLHTHDDHVLPVVVSVLRRPSLPRDSSYNQATQLGRSGGARATEPVRTTPVPLHKTAPGSQTRSGCVGVMVIIFVVFLLLVLIAAASTFFVFAH